MDFHVTSHLSHRALLLDLRSSRGSEARSTAVVLSRIAEVDARRLYRDEGYPSMYEFLIHDLHYSEGAAYKRLYAARAAWKFPLLYLAVADGKLHLSGVVLLAKHLTESNVAEWVDAATHKTKAEIEQLIANRCPRPDLPERLEVIASPPAWLGELSPGTVHATQSPSKPPCPTTAVELPAAVEHSPGTVEPPVPPSRITPLAPGRFGFQCTVDQETQDLWEYAKALLSHEIPTGEMALVLKAILKIAVPRLDQRKFAATDRPGYSRGSVDPRHIPAAVKREVRARDGGKCTFVGENGKQCGSRRRLEFHHDEEFARGGPSTAKNLRLLCRAHNQHLAERSFGAEFMHGKRPARGRGPHSSNVRDANTGEPL
jgi:hypothetical protein